MNKQPEVRARTRQKLIDAFWALCKEKNMNQISVGELARLAGYNRSTFYEYFTDIPDLLRQVEDTLLRELREGLEKIAPQMARSDQYDQPDAFHLIFQMLNEPMYCLLGPHGDPAFFSRVKEVVLPVFNDILHLPVDSLYFDYVSAYTYSALIGFLQHWYEQDQNLTEQEFFKLGSALLSHGVFDVLTGLNPEI